MDPTSEQGARAYRELLGEGPSDRSLMVQRASIVWNVRQKDKARKRKAYSVAAWATPALILIVVGAVRPFWPTPVQISVRGDTELHLRAPAPTPDLEREAAASLPTDATWQELYQAGFTRRAYQLVTDTGVELVLTRGSEADLELLARLALHQGDQTLNRRCEMAKRIRFRASDRAR